MDCHGYARKSQKALPTPSVCLTSENRKFFSSPWVIFIFKLHIWLARWKCLGIKGRVDCCWPLGPLLGSITLSYSVSAEPPMTGRLTEASSCSYQFHLNPTIILKATQGIKMWLCDFFLPFFSYIKVIKYVCLYSGGRTINGVSIRFSCTSWEGKAMLSFRKWSHLSFIGWHNIYIPILKWQLQIEAERL